MYYTFILTDGQRNHLSNMSLATDKFTAIILTNSNCTIIILIFIVLRYPISNASKYIN